MVNNRKKLAVYRSFFPGPYWGLWLLVSVGCLHAFLLDFGSHFGFVFSEVAILFFSLAFAFAFALIGIFSALFLTFKFFERQIGVLRAFVPASNLPLSRISTLFLRPPLLISQ